MPYTRVTEYKHLTGQTHPAARASRYEYPAGRDGRSLLSDPAGGEPGDLQASYAEALANASDRDVTWFVGRLGDAIKYYNMDQVVGQALATFRRMSQQEAEPGDADGAVLA